MFLVIAQNQFKDGQRLVFIVFELFRTNVPVTRVERGEWLSVTRWLWFIIVFCFRETIRGCRNSCKFRIKTFTIGPNSVFFRSDKKPLMTEKYNVYVFNGRNRHRENSSIL